ncbi:hypothetical protein LIER_34879 [Lithospermum erythrorhizon]|uniref:Uncharacterized protein n=1 Tax=Lithospermum erythrorhizon TaxID=34254 RepID=A0AAV3S486_LITER
MPWKNKIHHILRQNEFKINSSHSNQSKVVEEFTESQVGNKSEELSLYVSDLEDNDSEKKIFILPKNRRIVASLNVPSNLVYYASNVSLRKLDLNKLSEEQKEEDEEELCLREDVMSHRLDLNKQLIDIGGLHSNLEIEDVKVFMTI